MTEKRKRGRPPGSKNKVRPAVQESTMSTSEMTTSQLAKGAGVVVEDVSKFLKDCYKLKPNKLIMNELTWKFLVRSTLRGSFILLTGPTGEGKTMAGHSLVDALKRPFFNIPLGSTQDPRTSLIGTTNFDKSKGTYFSESYFVQAIRTPNAIILLDELSRAHPDAWNILMPVLDSSQRFLRLEEEGVTVPVAEGVSFVSTANIGSEYTATRVLDRALLDRATIVEVEPLGLEDVKKLLYMEQPKVDKKLLDSLAEIRTATRKALDSENSKLATAVSTRIAVTTAALLADGFTLEEAAEVHIYPFFSRDGGADSERTFVKQIVQKHCGTLPEPENVEDDTTDDERDKLFTDEEVAAAKP